MLKFEDFFDVLNGLAPLELSELSIKDGGYDNSGVIAKTSQEVNRVLFSLDLSDECVKKAIELNCDTIVTHHPAIYYPIKSLSVDGANSALITAIKNQISVISMHLNLDVASGGIDEWLSSVSGGKLVKVLDVVNEKNGYGRECEINLELFQLVEKIKSRLQTDKIIAYGSGKCQKIASFCGGGASHALKAIKEGSTDADVVMTSDLAHHEIKEIIESGRKLVIIPHYASEQFGFREFEKCVKELVDGKVETHYFLDKRFM